ncbi:Fic family protein [Gracilimonas sp.]|uniref:Fic family protein n=1 Tax=Gracilimonas sp. TaxID=1974203 RepID=UPI0032ED27F4
MPQMPLYTVNPDRNEPWNALPELPIHQELYRSLPVYEQLGKAKEALALLAGRSVAIPNPGVLINSITLQEAKDSSAIENIFTTDDELYQAFSDARTELEASGSAKEVLRYRQALWQGYNYLNQQKKFDLNYFIKLYQEIKEAGDGIRPPFARTYIRMGGSGPNAGKPIYTPPRGEGVVESKLDNLIQFLNDPDISPAEPLLKLAIAHYQFEVIHPFRDGNGRVGRIMNIHLLTHSGLLELPILYLSRYIIQNKEDYYETLAGVSQRGDWESWFMFMLKAVESTARLTYQKVNDIIETKESLLDVIRKKTSVRRPEQLTEAIFSQPYVKVNHLVDNGIYAENTARNYLNELSEIGVLEKRQIKGKHYYVNMELEQILSY